MDNFMTVAVLAFAIWRVGKMLSDIEEAGPGDILHKIRHSIGVRYDEHSEAYGKNWVAQAVLCIKCVSIWLAFAATIGFMLIPKITLVAAFPFALSGVVVFIDSFT